MQSCENTVCVFYVLLFITGVFGNFLLLYLYGSNLITNQRRRPIDLIFINLSFSNIVLILFKEIPFAIYDCICILSMSDIQCKIVIYLQRVALGVSICTSCLLSVYQAITISSGSHIRAALQYRAPKCLVKFCVFIWVLNLLTDLTLSLYVTGPRNYTNNMLSRNIGYCSIDMYAMTTIKLTIWKSLYDAGFVAFMAITSCYTVLVLFRHHRQVQHIHKTSLSHRSSPETRATKAILLLICIFICFYSISTIMAIILDNSKAADGWGTHISALFNLFYPTISPYVLITSDSQILISFNAFKRIKKVLFPCIKVSEYTNFKA